MSEAISTKRSFWQKRFTVLGISFLAFIICYLDRVNISIAAVAMQEELGWSDTTKGYVFSAFFWGYLIMQLGGGYLANRFGGVKVLGAAVIFWSIFTVITPWAAMISLPALLAVRFLMGVGEAGLPPSSFTVIGRWFPHQERSRALGLVSSGSIIGTVLALLVGSWIVQKYGWEAIFYIFGATGFIWALFWFWMVREHPDDHPSISEAELDHIKRGGGATARPETIPWKQIFSVRPLWALCTTGFATSWALYIFISWLPSYFADVHGLDLTGAGIYSLIPWLAMAVMLNVSGWAADKMIERGISTTLTRKLMVAIGLFGAAIMILFLRSAASPEMATFFMSAALAIVSFTYAGIVPNCLDMAPRFADIMYGVVNTFSTLAGAIGAFITGYIVQQTGSYDLVFLVMAIIQISGGLIFLFLGTGKRIID